MFAVTKWSSASPVAELWSDVIKVLFDDEAAAIEAGTALRVEETFACGGNDET